MIERPSYYDKIAPFVNKPVIKVISGMRRIGKSTFLKLLIASLFKNGVKKENILFINKEIIEFDFISDFQTLYKFVKKELVDKKEKCYLFIDEVQEIRDWERAVNSFLAEDIADIYLTGSNARLFSSELATLLTGRYVEIQMFPLSFKEFLEFRHRGDGLNPEAEFSNYLKYGGLPGIHILEFKDEIIFQYINSIYNTILIKDIVSRYKIRDVQLLERIAKFIFDNCGNITTSKKVSDFLKSQHIKIGVQTVQNYIGYLEETFLIKKTNRYDIKGKKYLEFYEKYYSNDTGIRHSLLKYRSDDIAVLLENVVYMELLRRGYSVSVGKVDKFEIDFIAEKTNEKQYFQVSYLLASKETEEREFRPLELVKDNYKKTVLTMDKVWGNERNGIVRKNIIDFLLEK
jgi:uncharacterized protein